MTYSPRAVARTVLRAALRPILLSKTARTRGLAVANPAATFAVSSVEELSTITNSVSLSSCGRTLRTASAMSAARLCVQMATVINGGCSEGAFVGVACNVVFGMIYWTKLA